MSRGLSDHHVELRAAAAVDVVVATCAHHAVAVHEPGAARDRLGGDRKAVHESNLGGVGVGVGELRDREPAQRPLELGADRALRRADRLLRVRVAPLYDVVVLGAHHGESVEIVPACERLDVRDVMGGELRRELDDDPAGGQLEVERVLRIERSPVGSGRGAQHFRGGERLFPGLVRGRGGVQRGAGAQQRRDQAQRRLPHASLSSQ